MLQKQRSVAIVLVVIMVLFVQLLAFRYFNGSSGSSDKGKDFDDGTERPCKKRYRMLPLEQQPEPEHKKYVAMFSNYTLPLLEPTRYRCVGTAEAENRTCEFWNTWLLGGDTSRSENNIFIIVAAAEESESATDVFKRVENDLRGVSTHSQRRDRHHRKNRAVVIVRPYMYCDSFAGYEPIATDVVLLKNPHFFVDRFGPHNIAHTIHDDFIPLFGAYRDLGNWLELFDSIQVVWHESWGQHKLVTAAAPAIASRAYPPMKAYDLVRHVGSTPGKPILFERMGTGTWARSIHSYTKYGVGPHTIGTNLMRDFRTWYLKNIDVPNRDQDWSKQWPIPEPKPLKVVLVNKGDKRVIVNAQELVNEMNKRYKGQIDMQLIMWEKVSGGYASELKLTQDTNILISADGTGASSNVQFLPPGSVFISVGTHEEAWVFPNRQDVHHRHLADFIYGSIDHLKCMYYTNYTKEEFINNGQGYANWNMRVDPDKFQNQVFDHAVKLARRGYPLPVPHPQNLSKASQVCVEILRKYPELAKKFYDDLRNTMCSDIMRMPIGVWKAYMHSEPPSDIAELMTMPFPHDVYV